MAERALWSIEDLVRSTGGQLEGEAPPAITGLSIDSRTVAPGEAFFAIRGERLDGHEFVRNALDAGAAVAVIHQSRAADLKGSGVLLGVPDDPLDALVRLARAARERSRGGIVGVTGSAGKTGTKEALRLALRGQGPTHASTASFNNHWGVPLSLARMSKDARYGIFEIGMNHPGEITPLAELVRPHVAIVTTIAPAHLAAFASLDAIAEAKAEIFRGLERGGTAVINRDVPQFELLADRARAAGAGRIIGFGEHAEADFRLLEADRGQPMRVRAILDGITIAYEIGAPGRHVAMNSLAVLAAARTLGADLGQAVAALAELRPPKGRGERFDLATPDGTFTVIDESYNANPASMRAAIALLAESPPLGKGRRIAVLGDMLELGSAGADLHRELAEPIAEGKVDIVFAAGPLMAALWERLPQSRRGHYAVTSSELEPVLLETVGPGDVVMIKGSLGSRMRPLVEALASRFPAAGNEWAESA